MTYKELLEKLNINRRKGENKEETVRLISMVSDETNREILTMRYIENKKWQYVARDTYFSMKTVNRRGEKGLREIVDKLNCDADKEGENK